MNPDSEQIEWLGAVLRKRNSVSVEQNPRRGFCVRQKIMKKKFDIRKTFETFLREPLSILTEGLFQIVNIQANIFNQESSFSIDFIKNKTQLTVVNNEKMANLFQTVLYKSKVKEVKEKAAASK